MKQVTSLKKHKLPQLTQYKIDDLNSSITVKEVDFVILKLLEKKSPGPISFTAEFYQTFRKELI